MNIAEFSIKKQVITLVLTATVLIAGFQSYQKLSRLEDPEFTIKQAVITTAYPGASAKEVAEEVTNVVEKAVQEMGQLDYVESKSSRNLSTVKVYIKDQYDKFALPQVWDELRRKMQNVRSQLPPGAGTPIVNDDFGDVYGVYVAITGDGYSYAELKDTAEFLRKELLQVQDVKKVTFYGDQNEVIYVEMNREKMAQLGISQQKIYAALAAKNVVADAGSIYLGSEFIPVNPTGEFKSEKEFGELLIGGQGSDRLIYLKDVATVTRGYEKPARFLLKYDGTPAVGLGVSTVMGGNAVTMGDGLKKKIKEVMSQIPVGIKMNVIYLQSEAVKKSINDFVVSLYQSVIIVVLVLLFFMGLRSGLIIGWILILTIAGTFIFMSSWGVTLERISLGALIIALGMLVDNAIVVTEGMKVKMEAGGDALQAAKDIVGQTAMPLLGATIVAVTAFAAIGTSQDSTGEYCRTLFQVILISLMFSWVTAVAMTPLFCKMFLVGKNFKPQTNASGANDPYAGKMFTVYRDFLVFCLKKKWLTVWIVGGMFVLAMVGFKTVPVSFFPNSTSPQYFVNFWLPEGSQIEKTAAIIDEADAYMRTRKEITHTVQIIGGGEVRFLLVYPTEMASRSYGQLLVMVDDYKKIDKTVGEVQKHLSEMFPDVTVVVKKFILGPGEGGKIQLRISGPDVNEVRKLAEKARAIIVADPGAKGVFDNWREKVKVVRPQVAEAQARRLGIERPDIAKTIEAAFQGTNVGVYREKDKLISIVARSPESERLNVDNLGRLEIWSPAEQKMIPLAQIVSGYITAYEDANLWRRNRSFTLKIHADPVAGLPSVLFKRIKAKVEQALNADTKAITGKEVKPKNWNAETIQLYYKNEYPIKGMAGYSFGWGGEGEDSAKANSRLSANLPKFFALMVLIVIFLFNNIKEPLAIWLTVPLSVIGVTVGLLLFRQSFGFMPLLGLLSLSGMLIKNAIVLIDEINAQVAAGKAQYDAVVISGVSRLRPVAMAAGTTVLGMIPLLKDAFFVSMAVTIMFGLAFATVLTLVFVPVLYTIFYRVPVTEDRTPSGPSKSKGSVKP
jgi:multidrug efflux pump subunit AcrB